MSQLLSTQSNKADLIKIKRIQNKSNIRPSYSNKVQQKYDYMIKLIVVGDSGVGKTNIIQAFCNSEYRFALNHVPTIGVDFSSKIIQLENKRIKLQVWDTAGQERFRTITETYYKGAAGIFLVYSVGSRKSFNNIKKWMAQIKQRTAESVQVVLIANKIDLPDQKNYYTQIQRQQQIPYNINQKNKDIIQSNKPIRSQQQSSRVVSRKQGWDLAVQFGISYHEVSAKLNEKIDEIFYNMAEAINNDLEGQLNDTILEQNPGQTVLYKINNLGTIELSTKGGKKTKLRSKKGIVYHKQEDFINQKSSKMNTIKSCPC